MVARIDSAFHPVAAGIYLPITNETVIAQLGKGAYYNGQRINVASKNDIKNCLVSICANSSQDQEYVSRASNFYKNILQSARNIRSTNSAADYFYSSIGRLEVLVNFTNKVWDVAPVSLIAQEAGMKVTDINGGPLDLRVDPATLTKNFTIVVANPGIHGKILEALKQSNNPTV